MNIADAIILFAAGVTALAISIRIGQLVGSWLGKRRRVPHKPYAKSSTNDAPLTHPSEDRLGYASFAQHLAQSLMEIRAPKGFVLAITGPWGTGKTSVLNFIEHYLINIESENSGAEVVRFNPWWFAGREDLTRRFFDQLQLAVNGLDLLDSATAAELQRLENALATAGAPGILRSFLTLGLPREQDVPEVKQRVAERLASQDRRIVVFVDDIDRLDAREIADVFMLIKAVGDFPNVLYVLAFDHHVVSRALESAVSGDGSAYIEKIVQTSFDLPAPDPVTLREIFLKDLNPILEPTPEFLFDSTHWGNVFWDGIAPILTTPRRVIRLLNAIRVTYPPLIQEVNGVDFVGLEVVRVFANDVYHLIRNNPQHFVGDPPSSGFPRSANDAEAEFHRAWESRLPTILHSPITALVRRLFPRVEAALAGRSHSSEGYEDAWKRQRRLCHRDIFPVFFQLSVPEGSQSRAEIAALVAIAGNQEAFSSHLLASAGRMTRAGTSRVRQELEELLAYVDDIPNEAVPSVVRTFFDIGDQLLVPEDEGSDFVSFGNDIRMGRLTWALLRRFPEPTRFRYLHDAIRKGRSLTIAVHEATTLAQQHGEFEAEARPPEDRILASEHLQVIKQLVVEKIEDAAALGQLEASVDLGSILYRWKAWGSEERVSEWVHELVSSDEGFLTLINAFTGEARTLGEGDLIARIQRRLSLKSLSDFISREEAIARAREMSLRTDLDAPARETIQLLLRTAEELASGRNPNFPFNE